MSILLTGVGKIEEAVTSVYWNPSDKAAAVTLSNGNKSAQASSSAACVRSVTSHSGGKYSYEYVCAGAGITMIGIANASKSLTTGVGLDANSVGVRVEGSLTFVFENSSSIAFIFTGGSIGDVFHLDWDLTNKKLYIAKNGVYMNSANPVAGTGGTTFSLGGTVYAVVEPASNSASCVVTWRNKAADMSSIPSGYSEWG